MERDGDEKPALQRTGEDVPGKKQLVQRLRRGRAGGFEELSTKALRLEVGELRVSSQTGNHGSGHVGTGAESRGCVSNGMGSHWSQEVLSPGGPHQDGSPATLWKRATRRDGEAQPLQWSHI